MKKWLEMGLEASNEDKKYFKIGQWALVDEKNA